MLIKISAPIKHNIRQVRSRHAIGQSRESDTNHHLILVNESAIDPVPKNDRKVTQNNAELLKRRASRKSTPNAEVMVKLEDFIKKYAQLGDDEFIPAPSSASQVLTK
jgi:vacuolar-type H+-ATPase catalytic subunit A/Vma1